MQDTVSKRLKRWFPIPIVIGHAWVLSSVAVLGPAVGLTLFFGGFFLIICIALPAGFVLSTLVLSQFSDVAGMSESSVSLLKWGVTATLLIIVLLRSRVERTTFDYHMDAPEQVLFGFALWCCACSMFSYHARASLVESLRIATYPFVVILVREILTTRRSIATAIAGYGLAVVIGVAYSFYQSGGSFVRLAGLSGNANAFGLFLSCALPVLVASAFAFVKPLPRTVFIVLAALSAFALMMTWSRASLLSIVVQGIVACILFKRKKFILIGGALVVLTGIAVLLIPSASDLAVAALRLRGGTTHRAMLWEAGLAATPISPIVGHGFELQVAEIVPQVHWGNWHEGFIFRSLEHGYNPHNLYLYLALSVGFPGLLIFLAMIKCLLMRHLRLGRLTPSRQLKIAHFTLVAMIVGALANGFFESGALIGRGAVSNYFWVAVGIVLATEKLVSTEVPDMNR